jgi:hypothetical protein
MSRYIVQSLSTGAFLVPGEDGQPEWARSLKTSGVGVFFELDRAYQLIEDWCDSDDMPSIIDLDILGTTEDI